MRARKLEFTQTIQLDLGRPVPRAKIIRFVLSPNQWFPLRHPGPIRGVRVVTDVGPECDGRESVARAGDRRARQLVSDDAARRTSGVFADGEVVWSWRSDAGAKVVKTLTRLTGDGGNQAWSPRRARRKPLKPLRREGRMLPPVPVVLPRAFCCTRTIGASGHPAFPAPSVFGGTCLTHNSGAMRCENASACDCASESLKPDSSRPNALCRRNVVVHCYLDLRRRGA
jgi:hypothetical protein